MTDAGEDADFAIWTDGSTLKVNGCTIERVDARIAKGVFALLAKIEKLEANIKRLREGTAPKDEQAIRDFANLTQHRERK